MEAIGEFIKNFVLNENRFILETIFFWNSTIFVYFYKRPKFDNMWRIIYNVYAKGGKRQWKNNLKNILNYFFICCIIYSICKNIIS